MEVAQEINVPIAIGITEKSVKSPVELSGSVALKQAE